MKFITKYIFLLLLMLLALPAFAQFNIGLMGVANSASLNGNAPPRSKYTSNKGVGGGVFAEFKIAKDVMLSVQPMFLPKGANIAVDVPGEKEKQDSLRVNLDYIALPLMFKVIAGNGKTYVIGGVEVGILQDATLNPVEGGGEEQDIKDVIRSVDVAVNFGFGAMFPLGSPRLFFEVRYAQGLSNISEVEADPESDSLPPQFKTTGFQFFAGLMLPLGKPN